MKHKTEIEKAAGKLISAIQKEWGKELGEPEADVSEKIIDKGHDLLQAAKKQNLNKLLEGKTVTEYLGNNWIKNHQTVKQSISNLERAINEEKYV